MTLHIAGNICTDVTMRLAALPRAGETLNALECRRGPGGKGANQALAAGRVGAPIRFWSAIGDDSEGFSLLSAAGTAGLPTDDIVRVGVQTDMSVVLIDGNGENMIASCVTCARALGGEFVSMIAEALGEGDMLLLQGNLTAATTRTLARHARSAGAGVAINASPLEEATFEPCDLLVVNRGEAELLSGADDMYAAVDLLCARGATSVVVTLGAEGAVGSHAGTRFECHAAPMRVVDTSGAGDVFCGVLVALWHGGMPLPDAASFAVSAASLAVTRPGTFDSCPSRGDMQALFARKD